MSSLWFVVLAALGLIMAVSLLVLIPEALVSLFRYELWRVRDELFDAIHAGAFSDTEQPLKLLRRVEMTIEVFSELTFLKLVAVAVISRNEPPDDGHLDLQAMTKRDHSLIMPFLWRWAGITLRRILIASWSGVFVFIALAPALVAYAAIQRLLGRRDKGDGGSVIHDTKVEFHDLVHVEDLPVEVLARPRHGKTRVALSSYL
jgi:hypothetical protein